MRDVFTERHVALRDNSKRRASLRSSIVFPTVAFVVHDKWRLKGSTCVILRHVVSSLRIVAWQGRTFRNILTNFRQRDVAGGFVDQSRKFARQQITYILINWNTLHELTVANERRMIGSIHQIPRIILKISNNSFTWALVYISSSESTSFKLLQWILLLT